MEKTILTGSINLSKLDKSKLFKSEKTGDIFLNIVVFVNEKPDKYDNDAAIAQSKDKGDEGDTLYLGNLREIKPSKPVQVEQDDDLPDFLI